MLASRLHRCDAVSTFQKTNWKGRHIFGNDKVIGLSPPTDCASSFSKIGNITFWNWAQPLSNALTLVRKPNRCWRCHLRQVDERSRQQVYTPRSVDLRFIFGCYNCISLRRIRRWFHVFGTSILVFITTCTQVTHDNGVIFWHIPSHLHLVWHIPSHLHLVWHIPSHLHLVWHILSISFAFSLEKRSFLWM